MNLHFVFDDALDLRCVGSFLIGLVAVLWRLEVWRLPARSYLAILKCVGAENTILAGFLWGMLALVALFVLMTMVLATRLLGSQE